MAHSVGGGRVPDLGVFVNVPERERLLLRLMTRLEKGQTHKGTLPEWVNVTITPREVLYLKRLIQADLP